MSKASYSRRKLEETAFSAGVEEGKRRGRLETEEKYKADTKKVKDDYIIRLISVFGQSIQSMANLLDNVRGL